MGDRPNYQQDAESSNSPITDYTQLFQEQERCWSQNATCKQVGNIIVCTNDIYGASSENKPNEAFRAIFALQKDLALNSSNSTNTVFRASDTQPPPYYPPGTLMIPGAGLQADSVDIYSFHQGAATKPGTVAQDGGQQPGPIDPYSYHPGDKTPPVVPPVSPLEIPQPLPPGPPQPGDKPPVITAPKPEPIKQPGQDYKPCQPCRPCRPCWYPGKIAGRVIGRVFRCR